MGAALTLATGVGVGNGYMIRISSQLAHNGYEERVTAMRTGTPTSDAKVDVLTDLVREAAANPGNVTDTTWKPLSKPAGVMRN